MNRVVRQLKLHNRKHKIDYMILPNTRTTDWSKSKLPHYRLEFEKLYLTNPQPTSIITAFDLNQPESKEIAISIFGNKTIESFSTTNTSESLLTVQIPFDRSKELLSRIPGFERIDEIHANDELATLIVSGNRVEWISMPIPTNQETGT
jgi:hypothetical protein